ncbi:MAG: sulfur carrier protein ThiS [Solirubrobacteraceae bacterium]|nr:sulfur carrier protein ThiS [Solirubrobacteraceae bacterium]
MISVNGEPRELPAPATVAALLDALGVEPRRRGIAVAVGAEVVPRAAWEAHELRAGDRVEVLTAIQGG